LERKAAIRGGVKPERRVELLENATQWIEARGLDANKLREQLERLD
jgi:hypothetical protein